MTESNTDNTIVHISDDLEPLIPKYLDNRRKEIEKAFVLLLDEDVEQLRVIGHTLKGSGGAYGFTAISALGERIENAAKQGDKKAIDMALKELGRYIETVQIVFVKE